MNSSKNDAPNEGKQRWSVAIIRLIGQEFPPKVAEGGGNFTLMMPSRRKRLVGVTIIGSGHPLKTRFSPRTCPTRYQPICCAPARPPLKPQIWPSRSDDHPQEHCHRGSPSAPATTGVHHHWSLGGGPPPHLMKLQEPSGKIQLLLVTVIDPTKSEAPDRRRSSALDSGTTIPCHCGLVELHSPPPTGGSRPGIRTRRHRRHRPLPTHPHPLTNFHSRHHKRRHREPQRRHGARERPRSHGSSTPRRRSIRGKKDQSSAPLANARTLLVRTPDDDEGGGGALATRVGASHVAREGLNGRGSSE